MSFIFGGNTNLTYDDIQRKRAVADQLLAGLGTPRNVGEGLSAIGKALAIRGMNKQASKADAANRDAFNSKWAGLFGGGAPGVSPASAPVSAPSPRDPSSPQGIADDAMSALGKTPMGPYRDAIASIESAGSGDYGAVGPTNPNLGRALGRYQIMEANIGPWSKEALGREITPDEFLANPQLQDAIFDHKFGGYVQQFGPEGAAQAWFAGPGGVGQTGRKDVLGTSVGDYTNKFTAALGGQGGQPGGMNMATLAEIAGDPYASPGQKAIVNALLQQQLNAGDPAYRLDLELKKAQLEAARNPEQKDTRTDDMREYAFASQQAAIRGQPVPTFDEWTRANRAAGAANQTVTVGGEETTPPDEGALMTSLGKKEGEVWASYLESGATSAGTMQDMQLLDEIITMAPQGPIEGRLAGAFPGISSAADAFTSVVKRVAPTLRAPGSGATSDIEYDGMLKSLPQLSSRPEANVAISAMMKAKAQINVERANIVRSVQSGELSIKDGRKAMSELDSRSIMTPELKAILGGLAPASGGSAPEGVDQDVWDVMTPEERALWQN